MFPFGISIFLWDLFFAENHLRYLVIYFIKKGLWKSGGVEKPFLLRHVLSLSYVDLFFLNNTWKIHNNSPENDQAQTAQVLGTEIVANVFPPFAMDDNR